MLRLILKLFFWDHSINLSFGFSSWDSEEIVTISYASLLRTDEKSLYLYA